MNISIGTTGARFTPRSVPPRSTVATGPLEPGSGAAGAAVGAPAVDAPVTVGADAPGADAPVTVGADAAAAAAEAAVAASASSTASVPETNARYPGTSGSTHGEAKDTTPATNARTGAHHSERPRVTSAIIGTRERGDRHRVRKVYGPDRPRDGTRGSPRDVGSEQPRTGVA